MAAFYRGELSSVDDVVSDEFLAPDFTMVLPTGRPITRAEARTLFAPGGRMPPKNPGFNTEATDVQVLSSSADGTSVVVAFVERQSTGAKRFTTAVMVPASGSEGGRYVVRHMHESDAA